MLERLQESLPAYAVTGFIKEQIKPPAQTPLAVAEDKRPKELLEAEGIACRRPQANKPERTTHFEGFLAGFAPLLRARS